MRSPFDNRQFKMMLSYFTLAVAIIIAYKFIMGFNAFLGLFRWLLNVISPFFFGFLIAYVLNIPCGGIRKLLGKVNNKYIESHQKVLSIIIVYLLSFFVVFLILRVVMPYFYRSIFHFITNFGSYYRSAQDLIDHINNLELFHIDVDKILISAQEFTLQKLPSSINTLVSISVGLFSGFLALISSVYILLEKENFKEYLDRFIKVFLPDPLHSAVIKYSKSLNSGFKQYIFTQTIDGCILGSVATIELFILGSPYAPVLGIMLGIVNYIPYFGSIFGTIFTVLIVAFTQDITTGLIAAVILLITQQMDANVIQPRLMSGSFSLSPLLVIISITIGGAISGMMGMIVAIPIVAVIKEIFDEVLDYYENRKP